MPAKLESYFPKISAHRLGRSGSSTDVSKNTSPKPSGTSSPTPITHTAPTTPTGTLTPTRPAHSRSHSNPSPSSFRSIPPSSKPSKPSPSKGKETKKQPPRAFGTNYRVRRTPPGTPPTSPPNGSAAASPAQSPYTSPLASPSLSPTQHSSVRDFAPLPSSVPNRRKPVYSFHEADPASKERPQVTYTQEELLRRLNTIGEDEDESVERVKTADREREKREWEEERVRKEEREMEEWERRGHGKAEKRRGGGLGRGFSWKGVKNAVSGR